MPGKTMQPIASVKCFNQQIPCKEQYHASMKCFNQQNPCK